MSAIKCDVNENDGIGFNINAKQVGDKTNERRVLDVYVQACPIEVQCNVGYC